MDLISVLSAELNQPTNYIENVITLMDEGNTIPFIARYRKELHGGMDDTTLRKLEERLQYLRNLDKRREEILHSIENQGKLTEELTASIEAAVTLAELEDLYRPYKQKRRTRATMAREKGLAPLAELLFAQKKDCPTPEAAAAEYVDAEKGVNSEHLTNISRGNNACTLLALAVGTSDEDIAAMKETISSIDGIWRVVVI